MDSDDLEPPKKGPKLKDLTPLSIEALHEYIADLELEIERVRGAIGQKNEAQNDAEKFFK